LNQSFKNKLKSYQKIEFTSNRNITHITKRTLDLLHPDFSSQVMWSSLETPRTTPLSSDEVLMHIEFSNNSGKDETAEVTLLNQAGSFKKMIQNPNANLYRGNRALQYFIEASLDFWNSKLKS
jgi:hypothetical protein